MKFKVRCFGYLLQYLLCFVATGFIVDTADKTLWEIFFLMVLGGIPSLVISAANELVNKWEILEEFVQAFSSALQNES